METQVRLNKYLRRVNTFVSLCKCNYIYIISSAYFEHKFDSEPQPANANVSKRANEQLWNYNLSLQV